MPGHTTMGIGAGPLYTNAVMGQTPSAVERKNARKASSSILRQDSIRIEDSENISRPESWSMHYDRTDQAPYSTKKDDEMMTQHSLLHLPPENPSHELAFFLRTTGPTASHRRPSKLEHPRRATSGSRRALRFLKSGPKRLNKSIATGHEWLDTEFRDEGGLLAHRTQRSIPYGVKQEVSSEGKKYLALQVDADPSILHSEVSVSVVGGADESEPTDDTRALKKDKISRRPPTPAAKLTSPVQSDDQAAVTADKQWSFGPFRLAPSNSATPKPQSAMSESDPYYSNRIEGHTKRSLEVGHALSSDPGRAQTSVSLPLTDVLLPYEQSTSASPLSTEDIDIKHPTPRRLASHPFLLQRASSITSFLDPRSVSDSPGPPPKSPLRLRREPRNIEEILASEYESKAAPKVAPSIKTVNDYKAETQPIKPTVITDCTGPIKRPRSRGRSSRLSAAQTYPSPRKEREAHVKARKLRDEPSFAERIDAVADASLPRRRQRLKKARPHIQIPDLQSAPPATRTSSTASSNESSKKVTEFPHTSVSTAPCEYILGTSDKADNTTISPMTSNGSGNSTVALSSVMLVAEEIPKSKSTPKPSKVVMKESKTYAPRPRSASIPRNSTRRRSQQAVRTPTWSRTPNGEAQVDEAPPLPSPSPTRALPPAPPVQELQKLSNEIQEATCDMNDEFPVSPLHEIAPNARGFKLNGKMPHVVTQTQRKRVLPKDFNTTSDIDARLEALEKHNALLSAALTAVLRTNGALNSPLPAEVENRRSPMVWENRVARRSAASQGGSSSNGTALEMYMNTRRGSKQGR